jgi:hypothetical protein
VTRQPNPLQWPPGWPRTPADQRTVNRALYETLYRASRNLIHGIRMLMPTPIGVPRVRPVITSDLPIDAEGYPRPGATAADPGIAVYWHWHGIEHVIACDRWASAADNIRALGKVVHLLRELGTWAPKPLFAAFMFDLAPSVEADRYPLVAALADLHGVT